RRGTSRARPAARRHSRQPRSLPIRRPPSACLGKRRRGRMAFLMELGPGRPPGPNRFTRLILPSALLLPARYSVFAAVAVHLADVLRRLAVGVVRLGARLEAVVRPCLACSALGPFSLPQILAHGVSRA